MSNWAHTQSVHSLLFMESPEFCTGSILRWNPKVQGLSLEIPLTPEDLWDRRTLLMSFVVGESEVGRPGPFPSLSVFSALDPSSPTAVPLTPFPFVCKAIQLCRSPSKSHITCIHHLAQQYKNVQVTKTMNNNYGNYYFFLIASLLFCHMLFYNSISYFQFMVVVFLTFTFLPL